MESSSELKALALDALSHTLPTGIAVLDKSFRYISINSILAEFNGVAIEQHLGRTVAEVLPALADTIMPLLEQVRDTGKALLNFSVLGDNNSGSEQSQWYGSYIPLFDTEHQLCGIAVVALNSTMDWFVQQTRKDDLERLRKILDNMFTFVGILSPDGTLLDSNSPPLMLAGITLDQVQHKKFWDCFWWQHDTESARRIEKAVEDARAGIISRFDITAQMKDGIVIIDFMLAPVYDDLLPYRAPYVQWMLKMSTRRWLPVPLHRSAISRPARSSASPIRSACAVCASCSTRPAFRMCRTRAISCRCWSVMRRSASGSPTCCSTTVPSMCSQSTIRRSRKRPSGCASRRRLCIPMPISNISSARCTSSGRAARSPARWLDRAITDLHKDAGSGNGARIFLWEVSRT